jgi:predicted MFS family arabinose efflux permease
MSNGELKANGARQSLLSRREWLLLLVLGTVQFTHIMDFMIVMPLGPQYMRELAISPEQFGFMVAAYAFSAALSGLSVALFIDRFDRKKALLFLFGGFAAGTLLCAIAPDYLTLVLARLVAGGFGGVLQANILAIVGDIFSDARRGTATGIVMAGFSMASIVGVPVGLLIANWCGFRAPFAGLAVLSVLVSCLGWWILPPLRGHLRRSAGPDVGLWEVITKPDHLAAYGFMTAVVMGVFLVTPYLPAYLEANVGLTEIDLAWMYALGGFSTLIMMPLAGRLSDRLGKLPVFRVSAFLTVVPILLLTHLPAASPIIVLSVTTLLFIFTSARWVPAMAMVTGCALPRYRGSFLSVCSSVQQTAAALASVVAGRMLGTGDAHELTGYGAAGWCASAAAVVSVVLAGILRSPEAKVHVPISGSHGEAGELPAMEMLAEPPA